MPTKRKIDEYPNFPFYTHTKKIFYHCLISNTRITKNFYALPLKKFFLPFFLSSQE